MNDGELAQCYALLDVEPVVSGEELERAFMRRNFALLKGRNDAAAENNPQLEGQRLALRIAYDRLSAHLRERQKEANAARKRPQLASLHAARPVTAPPMPFKSLPATPRSQDPSDVALLAFDNWTVNVFVPPVLLALVFLLNLSPLKFFLTGFQVWMHEFGHATASWLAGWRATPLPFGWTPVEMSHSNFVYFGLLLLLVILFVGGWKERKVWPMVAAVVFAGLQAYMTWLMPESRKEFWMIFGGVGGEFCLGTIFMMFFFVQLPEKFQWGACRYVFFLIGATAFLNIWWHWRDVYRGLEEIPFGSMINGEDDHGGDMNRLMDKFGWKKFDIRRNYHLLGTGCWLALGAVWLAFALRLNKAADWVVGKFSTPASATVE